MNRPLIKNSLAKRLSITFWILLLLLAAGQYFLLRHFWDKAWLERDQLFFWGLAEQYAIELGPYLQEPIQRDEVLAQIYRLTQQNPRVDIFILDETGTPRFFLPEHHEHEVLPPISLEEIKASLAFTKKRHFPLKGPNPRSCRKRQCPDEIFSAARLKIGDVDGYLYVPLFSRGYASLAVGIKDKYLLLVGALTSAVLTLALGAFGSWLFSLITQRFYQLAAAVRSYGSGDFEQRIPENGSDEVSQLARDVNQMADTIEAQIDQLRETDRIRRELVANISHDLNSPVTARGVQLQLLQMNFSEFSNDEKIERLRLSTRSVDSLRRLITELLSLANLEAKNVEPHKSMFNIEEMIQEEIFQRLAPVANERTIELVLQSDSAAQAVYADCDLIERALVNLVENALHYGEGGNQVLVELSSREGEVEVSVTDQGPGVPEADLPHIFERYYRGAEQRSSTKGSGLGLAIVKKIVEVHGSTIRAERGAEGGMRFVFRLPAAPST